MPTIGYGVGAAVGVGSETTEGTAVTPSVWLPITASSVRGKREVVETGTITGDRSLRRMLKGLRTADGDIEMEADGSTMGLMAYYANGKHSGALTSANMAGHITATPTAPISAGGTLANGVYKYKVASIWQRTNAGDSQKIVCPATAQVSATSATTNQTATVTFTDPTTLTPPDGFTYYGTAIYRTDLAGADNSQKFLDLVVGTAATYVDDGSENDGTVAIDNAIVPVVPAATMRSHELKRAFTTGTNPLQAFSTTVLLDNDLSERFTLCRMNSMEISVADGNSPVMAKFNLIAKDFASIANPSPSVTNLSKMMGWGANVLIDGAQDCSVESFSVTLNNNAEAIPGLCGVPSHRDVGYGRRQIDVSFARAFEDHDLWTKMRNATRLAFDAWIVGQPVVETVSDVPISASENATPIPYMIRIEVPKLALGEAGSPISGPDRMVENITAKAEVDETTGDDMILTIYNLTSTYA